MDHLKNFHTKKNIKWWWIENESFLDCSTTDGKQCVFPFKYKGVVYNGCTKTKNRNVLWCSTKTDEQGNYILGGNWGNCSETCQKGKAWEKNLQKSYEKFPYVGNGGSRQIIFSIFLSFSQSMWLVIFYIN